MWKDKFRFLTGRERESERVMIPELTLLSVDFNYGVRANRFESFYYNFDVGLSLFPKNRLSQARIGIETVAAAIEGVYSEKKEYRKRVDGTLSGNERKAEVSYVKSAFSDEAKVILTAGFSCDILTQARIFVSCYSDCETLFSAYESVLKLQNLKISPRAHSVIEQIERIRNGHGPTVEKFLLE